MKKTAEKSGLFCWVDFRFFTDVEIGLCFYNVVIMMENEPQQTKPSLRLLIVDDNLSARAGMKALLGSLTPKEVVPDFYEAGNGQEALQVVEMIQPDVVLMDVQMPILNGIEAARILKERWQNIKVVILTMYAAHKNAALSAGADEFLLKGCSLDELYTAVYGSSAEENNYTRRKEMEQETKNNWKVEGFGAYFQQMSAGGSLVIIAGAAIYYISRAWPMRPIALASGTIPDGYGALVLSTFGLIIVTEIILQVVLAIGAGSAVKPTVQEQAGSLKANRNASYVLVAGILAVIGLLFVDFPAFCMANLAMVSLLFSEITKFASQLFFYRKAN